MLSTVSWQQILVSDKQYFEKYSQSLMGNMWDQDSLNLKHILMQTFRAGGSDDDDEDDAFGKEQDLKEMLSVSSSETNMLTKSGRKSVRSLMDQFSTIYPLAYRITHKGHPQALYWIWANCCETVTQHWSTKMCDLFHGNECALLHYLLQCWTQYQDAINLFHSLTLYAEEPIAVNDSATGMTAQLPPLNEYCCIIFKKNFLMAENGGSGQQVFDAIVAVMEGSSANPMHIDTVRAVQELLLYLDSRNHSVYYRVFGLPYLKMLQETVCNKFEVPNLELPFRVIDYIKMVESIVNEQLMKAMQYGFSKPLIRMVAKLLYTDLLSVHCEQICSHRIFMELLHTNTEQLSYLYRIMSFDADAIKLIAANVERLMQDELNAISIAELSIACHCTVASFFEKCQRLSQYWFVQIGDVVLASEPSIKHAMEEAFKKFLNSSPIYACLLSIYMHLCSKTNTVGSSSISNMEKVTKILSFLEDKQAIEKYARHFLCTRLIRGLSEGAEEDVARTTKHVESLQVDSPFSFKLLIKDYKNSRIELKDEECNEKFKQEFEACFLNKSFWNLDASRSLQTFRLPKSFWEMYNACRDKFYEQNQKKSVQLNRNYGSAVMVANGFGSSRGVSFEFITSLRQAVILIAFNPRAVRSFKAIKAFTKMDDESLKNCIRVFHEFGLMRYKCKHTYHTNLEDCIMEISDDFNYDNLEQKSATSAMSTSYRIGCAAKVDWIKLEYSFSSQFNVATLMRKCATSLEEQGADVDESGEPNSKSAKEAPPVPKQPAASKPKAANSKHEQVEANLSGMTIRLEATVIRVLKRATIVADLKTLHSLTVAALNKTTWANALSPGGRGRLITNAFSQNDLKKIVDSLGKQGYLRCMNSGEIVYEP